MGELRQLIAAGAEDATLVESQADELLAELTGNVTGNITSDDIGNVTSEGVTGDGMGEAQTHPHPAPPFGVWSPPRIYTERNLLVDSQKTSPNNVKLPPIKIKHPLKNFYSKNSMKSCSRTPP
jgi:hypothetical protein